MKTKSVISISQHHCLIFVWVWYHTIHTKPMVSFEKTKMAFKSRFKSHWIIIRIINLLIVSVSINTYSGHMPDTPHVQPLSCELEWPNQKFFYCFLLKPVRDNLAPGFPRALPPWPSCAEKSSGVEIGSQVLVTISRQRIYFVAYE